MAVSHVPQGYHVVTPVLIVDDADALIDFLKRTFDASEHQLGRRSDGKVYHADFTIAGAHIMISEASPQFPATPAAVNVYVPDVDATYRRALDAGATSMMSPNNRFYGDRIAAVRDRTGVVWSLATHIEDVPQGELKRREAEEMRQMAT
jgi:PhnB protein